MYLDGLLPFFSRNSLDIVFTKYFEEFKTYICKSIEYL